MGLARLMCITAGEEVPRKREEMLISSLALGSGRPCHP